MNPARIGAIIRYTHEISGPDDRRQSRRWLVLLTTCVLAALLAGCSTTTVRSHPEFAAAKRNVRSVALVPADTQIVRLNFTGENERDATAEAAMRSQLADAAENALRTSGYAVTRTLLDRIDKGDKQLGFEYEQLNEAYARVSKDLYRSARVSQAESTSVKAGVGTSVNVLALAADADALLLARYRGYTKSGGMVAKDVIAATLLAVVTGVIAVPAKDGNAVEVALIDGVTGDVLWTNTASAPGAGTGTLGTALGALPQGSAPVATEETAGTSTTVADAAGKAPAGADQAASKDGSTAGSAIVPVTSVGGAATEPAPTTAAASATR